MIQIKGIFSYTPSETKSTAVRLLDNLFLLHKGGLEAWVSNHYFELAIALFMAGFEGKLVWTENSVPMYSAVINEDTVEFYRVVVKATQELVIEMDLVQFDPKIAPPMVWDLIGILKLVPKQEIPWDFS